MSIKLVFESFMISRPGTDRFRTIIILGYTIMTSG